MNHTAPADRHITTVTFDARQRYPWRAGCSCGWVSRGYVAEHAARTMADDHTTNQEEPTMKIDHTACYIAGTHPKTPAGRAECRKRGGVPKLTPINRPCPSCGAEAGARCTTKGGKVTGLHAAREGRFPGR